MIDVCLFGDCRESMREMIAAGVRVQTCVTSPPYWGLRDYGTATWQGGEAGCDHVKQYTHPMLGGCSGGITNRRPDLDAQQTASQSGRKQFRELCGKCGARRIDSQLGLESTPEQYVANMVEVFRLVRELLADDGTLWLNLGDSYAANAKGTGGIGKGTLNCGPELNAWSTEKQKLGESRQFDLSASGLKPKDLVGIPWRVAFALQQPYYSGRIKNVHDRIWLAAMIDAEGCFFIHKRKEGQSNGQGYERKSASYGAGLEVANTCLAIVERCQQITGIGSICSQSPDQNNRRKQTIYRWNVRSNECRWIAQEVYPYLVAKQHQARILLGCPPSGERADAAHQALIGLHNGALTDVDFPAPESLFQPGYYLRSDIIWSKANPMPESVTDRPTKAHEYLFLLSKRERYFYDAQAIAEQFADERLGNPGAYKRTSAQAKGACNDRQDTGFLNNGDGWNVDGGKTTRNRRTVWTVATEPYSEAHFATFPTALIEPCILAGTSQKGHCPGCGKGWVRVTENGEFVQQRWAPGEDKKTSVQSGGKATSAFVTGGVHQKITTGWQPSCACNLEPVPGIVFDPFLGSGTTAQVAQDLGRHWLGCELNSAYAGLQKSRAAQLGLALA